MSIRRVHNKIDSLFPDSSNKLDCFHKALKSIRLIFAGQGLLRFDLFPYCFSTKIVIFKGTVSIKIGEPCPALLRDA